MLESPTKRRRTSKRPADAQTDTMAGMSAVSTINSRLHSHGMKINEGAVKWPKDIIPVEIFSIIISFLSRSNVQNMRLVNKEFEGKVAHDLFQTVVVPFNPEIYGIAEERNAGFRHVNHDERGVAHAGQANVSVMLQDRGMRVFQGFGRHIRRFGMSFELDYQLLTNPPIKSDQEAITTFWGIYRWPFKKYNRYVQLEGLEQTADETRTMAKALKFINNSKELGLSIDGGLGWLAGPDVNNTTEVVNEKALVFGRPRFRPEETPTLPNSQRLKPSSPINSTTRPANSLAPPSGNEANEDSIPAFIRILREAGYAGLDLTQSIRTLMESEGVLRPSSLSINSPFTSPPDVSQGTSRLPDTGAMDTYLRNFGYEGARLDRMRMALSQAMVESAPGNPNFHPLKPSDLTNAQKEMLLETEWAQRAFMQSYAIAIIDNPATFQGIETLSIARLPSRHLTILRRGDFWTSLSRLRKISLAIIPDWRDVVKLPTSWVEDVRLPPSQAIWGVYQLLRDHIAPRKSVKTVYFEWLCGGEEASGIFARNQLILAAPLICRATDMLYRIDASDSLLRLPYVEHLTLKNCWISPEILVNFVKTLKTQSLKTLTFDSVSLSAPAPRNTPLGTINQQHHPINLPFQNFQVQATANMTQLQANQVVVGQAFAPPAAAQQVLLPQHLDLLQHQGQGQAHIHLDAASQTAVAPLTWLNEPRVGSWAHVIDQMSPGETLASMRHARDLGPQPPPQERTKLRKLIFISCGYIRLLLDFDQTMLDQPNSVATDSHAIAKRRNEIEQYMMKPQEQTLGSIINYIHSDEVKTLESAWNLRMGWARGTKTLIAQAAADGIKVPGQGRFRGKIDGFLSSSILQHT